MILSDLNPDNQREDMKRPSAYQTRSRDFGQVDSKKLKWMFSWHLSNVGVQS